MFPDLTKALYCWQLCQGHCSVEVFQKLHYFNLAWGLPMHTGLMTLTLVLGYRCVRIINCVLFVRFLSTIV